MRAWGSRAVIGGLVVTVLSMAPSASAAPVISSPGSGSTVTPGGDLYLESGRWYPSSGCAGRVKVTIKDSGDRTWNLGRFTPQFSLFEKQFPYFIYDRSVPVPAGMRPGPARMRAEQVWGVKFPVINICIDLFKVSASRSIVVEGAVGNDPPVITDLSAPGKRTQRTPQPVTWTASEPCAMTLSLHQSVGGVDVELGNIVEGHPGVAGANSYVWDSTFAGADLTSGTYELEARCTDPENSMSAPRFTSFLMGLLK